MLYPSDWVVIALASIFGAAGTFGAVLVWRDHEVVGRLREMTSSEIRPYWHAFIRAIPVGTGTWWTLVGTFALWSATSSGTSGESGLAVPTWSAVLGLSAVASAVIATLSVALFNRPSILVPPALRTESGPKRDRTEG